MFDLEKFVSIAPEWAGRLTYYKSIESTNDEAKKRIREGVESGCVILADHQTAGRGRRGSEWLSEPGHGLLFSIILKPEYSQQYWGRMSLVTGLAIATCLSEEWGLSAEIKWPNDILVLGKKCCGILVETQGDHVIIGVGLNVSYSPADDRFISVWEGIGKPVSREEILADVLIAIDNELKQCDESGFSEQLVRLRSKCAFLGKEIQFTADSQSRTGFLVGIGDSGELLVRNEGVITPYIHAESIRPLDMSY